MAKRKTFAQARSEILDRLQSSGWALKRNLKVPHATSPDGDLRLWFKTQAVYATCDRSRSSFGNQHKFTNARSITGESIDIRDEDVTRFIDYARKWCDRS